MINCIIWLITTVLIPLSYDIAFHAENRTVKMICIILGALSIAASNHYYAQMRIVYYKTWISELKHDIQVMICPEKNE